MLQLLLSGLLAVASPSVAAPQTSLPEPSSRGGSPAAVLMRAAEAGTSPQAFRATVVTGRNGRRSSTDWVLERYSLRSPQMSVSSWSASGEADTAAPPITTYR